MPIFKDSEFARAFLNDFWTDLLNDPDVGRKLKATGLTVAYKVTDLGIQMYIDENGIKWGEEAAAMRPAVYFAMSADTVHRFWLRQLNVVKALATGEVRARGPIPAVMKLLPLLKPASLIYRRHCESRGLTQELRGNLNQETE